MELVYIDVPTEYSGAVIEELGRRKGELIQMSPNSTGARMNIEYSIPARCLMGYRSTFMTATRGEGIINSVYNGYEPYKGRYHPALDRLARRIRDRRDYLLWSL